jgi:ribosome biogenesis GTPase YqeH
MIRKCTGCGAYLQFDKPELGGYVEREAFEKATLCRRCFRMRCYGDYVFINKDNAEYIQMLKDINDTGDLVIYLVDILNISDNIKDLNKYLHNPIILVLNKIDLLPWSVNINKIIKWLHQFDLKIIDIIGVSSEKNNQLDRLYKLINKHKKTSNVYIVGNTNSGKSTLINKLVSGYSKNKSDITTSFLPSTTLEIMDIKLNDNLILIDTPGLIDEGNIINKADYTTLKRIIPKKEIKPRVIQMEKEQSIVIDNVLRIDYVEGEKNSFTVFISNEVGIERVNYKTNDKLKKNEKKEIKVNQNEDIVINGLCWIKVIKEARINVYLPAHIAIYTRKSLV